MLTYIFESWEALQSAAIQFASAPRYLVTNFVGGEDQLAYEQYIVEQIKKRQQPSFALHSALYIFDAVRIETAIREFDTSTVKAAIFLAE